MSFRFTKAELARRDGLVVKLRGLYGKLEDEVASANEKIAAALAEVNVKVGDYNDALEEAKSFVADVAEDRRGEYDDKSERWQEGDRGQAAESWLGSLEGFDPSELTEATVPELDTVGDVGDDASSDLEGLEEGADE